MPEIKSHTPSLLRRADLLAETFVQIADTLVDEFDVVDILDHLAGRCTELFDASEAGIVLLDGQGGLRLMAATSESAEFIELLQIQRSEGPCYDCVATGAPVQVDDVASADNRWPEWAPVAAARGFQSAHAFPMRLRGQVLGALNLFRGKTGRLKPSSITEAQALADVATIAILQHRAAVDARVLSDQLHLALNSRIVIEQAKGIIAQSAGLDMDESFSRLRAYARGHSRQLSQIARSIIDGTITVSDLTPPDKGRRD